MTHRERLFEATAEAHRHIQDVGAVLLDVMGAESDGSISEHNLAYLSGYTASLLSVSNSIRKFKQLLKESSQVEARGPASTATH